MWSRRQASRAVVFDRDGRVLLLRAGDPFNPAKGKWWELPGGGIDRGESSAEAAAREIYEETGLTDVAVGPCVWRHRARFTFAGMVFDQDEHIHVAHWSGSAASGSQYRPAGLELFEAMAFSGLEWWTATEVGELAAAGEVIIPPWLADQLPRYLDVGAPDEPIDLGELGPVF